MSILKKNFGRRQDAIITDCFVVMPDGVTDADGNRRYCKIENAAWDTGATNTVITPEIVTALGLEPSVSCFNRRLNNANAVKRMTDFLGHSNNFATLSLSLSLSLSQVLTASPPHFITYAPVRVNIRLSMLSAMGSLIVFCLYLIQILI